MPLGAKFPNSLQVEIDDGVIQEFQTLQSAEIICSHLDTAPPTFPGKHTAAVLGVVGEEEKETT